MDIDQQTMSLDSYSIIRACGGDFKKAILEYLRLSAAPRADFEIMKFFGKPRNIVSSARNSLYRSGHILKVDLITKRDPGTGRKVIEWILVTGEPVPVEDISAKSILTKIKGIIKKADKNCEGITGPGVKDCFRAGAFTEIKDLVFSKKAIILPFNKANGTK